MNFILILDLIVKHRIPVAIYNDDGEPTYVRLDQLHASSTDGGPAVDVVYATNNPVRSIFSPDLVGEITFDSSHEGGLTATIHLTW